MSHYGATNNFAEGFTDTEYDIAEKAYRKVCDTVADVFFNRCSWIVDDMKDPYEEVGWNFMEDAYLYENDYLNVIADRFWENDGAMDEWIRNNIDTTDLANKEIMESAERVNEIVSHYDVFDCEDNTKNAMGMIHDACAGKNGLLNEPAFFVLAFEDIEDIARNEWISNAQFESMEDEFRSNSVNPDYEEERREYLCRNAYV